MAVEKSKNFITDIIDAHNESGRFDRRVHTRFPPEPNGYLHIGHAKSICLNFGIAEQYGGLCNLRFDDTNPAKEEQEYIDAIIEDVRWLGYKWHDRVYFASDYFDELYEMAVELIQIGKAYVDELSPDQIREYRGTLSQPGINSPYRDRPVEENLALFEKMRDGGFSEGEAVLRAKIDMSSGNINMRDPVMYRILVAAHPRTGDKWRIYPMYDFAHGQSDSIEGITHSICTLEYEDHRPLYDWYLDNIEIFHPQQIEFARLNLSHTDHEQAQADTPGAGRLRAGLGRSAHADHFWVAAARLYAGSHTRLLRRCRRRQGQGRGRLAQAGIPHSARPQSASAARDGGAQPAQGRHRELS